MTLEERLKRAENGRRIAYKGAYGSVTYLRDDNRPLPTAPDSSLENQRIAEQLGAQQKNEAGLQDWAEEMNQFLAQSQEEKKRRSGTWQDEAALGEYRKQQDAAISRLQQQANQYASFFSANRGVYGDKVTDSVLNMLDRGGRRLARAHEQPGEVEKFQGQFLDQDEFDTYQRLTTADAEELKAWNEELNAERDEITARYRTTGDGETYLDDIRKVQQVQNRVLNRYYELDNQQKLTELEGDPAAKALYQTANAKAGDAGDMLQRMRDRLDRGGRPEEDPDAMATIERVYGLSPEKSGSLAQYMNDLQSISGMPLEETEALAGMGYDYGRLSGYQQTQRDKARYEQEQARTMQTARKHPFLTSGASVLAAPFQGVDYMDMAIRSLTGGGEGDIENYVPLNVYNMGATNYVSGVRGAVSEKIAENTQGAELFGVNLPSFAYQTGMSVLDSAAQVAALGGASLPVMGAAAAAGEMQDIIARGGSNQQALMGGTAAGIAEVLFEKLSIDQLLKPKSVTGFKSLLKETAKQAGVEASEETFTEIANIISDAAIMGRDSSSALAEREYMLSGMSQEEARKRVFLDHIGQVAEAGAGGLLSGIGMGGASSAVNYALGGGQYNAVEPMQYRNKADNPQSAPAAQTAPFGKGAEGQAGLLTQAARDVAEREMAQEAAQEPAQAPSPQAAQNITPSARTAQEAAQGTTEAIQRAAADTSGQQRTQADTGAQQRTTQSAAQAAQAAQRTAAMKNANALVKASEVFGENGQKAFAAAWDGQQSADRYYAGFSTWYQAGLTGKAQNQVRSPYAGSISQDQQFAAYAAGQNDAAASLEREKAAAPYARTAGDEAGLVYDEYVAQAVENPQSAPPAQTAPFEKGAHFTAETAGRINTVAKALGVRVRFVDSVDGGRANAQISGSEILVERNNPNPVMTIVGHELTHRVQELSPESYRAFREAAVAELADSAVQAKLDAYRAQGENILYEQAMDEAAADYAGQLLEDGAVLDQFIERHRTDRTLLERLRDAFRALWQKLTGAERRKAQTAEGKLSAALDAAAEGADSLSKAQSPVSAYGAATPFQKGAEGPGADGETRYSLGGKEFSEDKYFARQMDRWTELGDGARVKVGMVRQGSALQQVGLPVNGMYFDTGKIKRAMSEHGDHLTAEVLKGIPDLLNDPIVITEYKGPDGKVKNTVNVYGNLFVEGKPVVVGVVMHLDHSGQNVISNIRTVHARSNFAKQITDDSVLYLNGDKKKVRSWFQVCGNLNVPLEGTKYGLIRSIAFDEGEVKRFSLKEAQLRAIQDSNPAEDDYHTWVRSVEDIKTFDEALSDPEWADYDEFDPDYTMEMARKAQKRGEITVYSSYPIQTGVFVTPSRMEAESYSGSSRVYSKTVKLDQVAWIDPTQGQFAPTSGDNSQYSLKGTTITKTYNQILRENDALRERLEYWRGQTRQTKEVTVDKKAVNAAAKDIVKEYGAQLDAGELSGRLQALYDHMARTWYDKGETEGSDVWKGAEEIARDIAGSAVAEYSLSDEFPGLRDKLKTTPITIGHEYDNDIHNEKFRTQYRGKLKLSSQGPTNVDAVYAELSESYPGLFPSDITHPADQMEQIMDVADGLSAVNTQMRFSGQMEEAVTGITNEIMEQFLGLDLTAATFADRQAAKLDKLREENRENVKRILAAKNREVQDLKDRYAQSRKNAATRRADSKARDRLLHIVKRLQNKKLPEVNRTLLKEYIGDLDTAAKSMTGKTLAKLEGLRDWYAEQKSHNPDFIADPRIEKDLERLSKRQIADLSAQEVADLTEVLLNIENEIRTQRKLIDSQERRDVYAAGEAAVRDIEASAGSKATGVGSLIDKNIVTEVLSPVRQVRRMTGYAKDSPLTKVTRELADGQRAMFDYQMKAEKQFEKYTGDKGFTKAFAGPRAKGIQIQGLGKDGPTTVTITPAMRASLYLHSLNDQNLKHIRDGGITVPDRKLYQKGEIAEAYARGTTIRLTPSQVRRITANMTQKERAFALAASRYFNVTSKEAINAVSEKLKGYSLAQVENYFPIQTDGSFTRAEFESIKHDGTIEGMGFLKERIDAANPIMLRDMSDVLDQSIRMHSKYAGLAIPVRNFQKLWNVTTGQWVDGDALADYNGAEGGDSYGNQYREAAGDYRRGEDSGADAGGAGTEVGADRAGPGTIAAWAEGAQVQDPGGPARKAVKTVRGYGLRSVVVQDAAIKARRANSMELTEDGVVYLSDALTEEDADTVANHAAVHAVKQRGSAAYGDFLDNTGGKLDFHSTRAKEVIDLVTDSRFEGQDFMDLTPDQQRTVFDELNAVVWGCYKADAENARAQFKGVFNDFDGYIQALGGVMEAEKTEAQASRRFRYEDSVKSAVKRKWGETGYGYIEKMMSDLQNGHKPTRTWAKAMNRLRSNYAGAVLTLNASVAMKQAASYPTAAAVLGWGPLAKAMGNVGKVDLDLIAKYTPLQWYRSKGFSTQELGDMRSANRQLPKVLNWVQGVDLITTRKLWKASEYYVQAHNKSLNRGTDAYYKAVADIYNQVIEETQPNYTTMQRPQLLRSDDSLLANLQMFKTQPFQNTNILYDAFGEFRASLKSKDKTWIRSARAKAGRAVTSQLAQLAVFAGMGMAWAIFRGKKKKYEDEDGELSLQSAMSALGKDMAGGALAGIPFGSDAWELLSSKLFGDTYYGMDAVTVQALTDTIKSLDGMGELIGNTVKAASAGDKIDWRSAGIKLDGYLDDISKAAGVPYENISNLFQAVYQQVAAHNLGELQGEYAAMKLTADPEKKSGEYYSLLYKALERGDLDSYFTIREELPELLGKDNSDIDAAMKSRYREKVKGDPGYSLSERAMDLLGIRSKLDDTQKEQSFSPDDLDSKAYQRFQEQRADRWRTMRDKIESSGLFKKLSNEEKDNALDYAWQYASQTALEAESDGKYTPSSSWVVDAQKAEKQGVKPWEFALNKAAYNTDTAYNALERGDLDEYKALRGKFMDVLDKEGTAVDSAMRRQYEEKLEENPEYTLEQAAQDLIGIHPSGSSGGDSFGADDLERAAYDAYTVQRAGTYRETVDDLEGLESFRDMDQEARDKLMSTAYTMAHQTALADNSGGQYTPSYEWVRNADTAQEEYDIEPWEFLLWKAAYDAAFSDKDENGKEIKGRKKSDKVKSWLLSQDDLTDEQRAFLWGTEYKSEW